LQELQLVFEPTNRHMTLLGYDIEAKTGEQKNIRPLQPSLTRGTR
jgi:hypothetical protein